MKFRQKAKIIALVCLLSALLLGAAERSGPVAPLDEIEAVPRLTSLGRYYITGYDTCEQCCGKADGITASGAQATVGRTCAVNGLDFGTVLYIDGIGERVVEDRGGMAAGVIDMLCEDHAACYAITGWYEVWRVDFPAGDGAHGALADELYSLAERATAGETEKNV